MCGLRYQPIPSINDPDEFKSKCKSFCYNRIYRKVTDINGETAEDSVIVTVNPLPVVDAGSDDTICVGESIQLGAPAQVDFRMLGPRSLQDLPLHWQILL